MGNRAHISSPPSGGPKDGRAAKRAPWRARVRGISSLFISFAVCLVHHPHAGDVQEERKEMSDIDPQTLEMFAYIAAGVGLVQLIYGVTMTRSTDPAKQFISCVMQSGGLGFLAAAAICYFANMYDWA